MSVTIHRNAELNELVILLGRSLLQFARESWPWSDNGADGARARVEQLAARQRGHVAGLCRLLAERGWPIEFGTYPTEFGDLFYVSLDFLLRELARHKRALTSEIEAIARGSADDFEAAPLVQQIVTDHRDDVRQLAALTGSRLPTVPA